MTTTPTSARATLLATTARTPAGDIALVVDEEGAVRAAGYAALDAVLERMTALARGPLAIERVPLGDVPGGVVDVLHRYAAGDVAALDDVVVRQPGGEFFQAAWREMRAIPPGSTVTYTELAARAGRPLAVRAAGSACARNLVAPFVPCHRIVRTDGSLGGYAYGLVAKEALLRHERRALAG